MGILSLQNLDGGQDGASPENAANVTALEAVGGGPMSIGVSSRAHGVVPASSLFDYRRLTEQMATYPATCLLSAIFMVASFFFAFRSRPWCTLFFSSSAAWFNIQQFLQ